MNILILFSSSNIGGAEKSLSRMTAFDNNINYQLATLGEHGEWSKWVSSLGIEPLVLGEPRFCCFSYFKLYKLLRNTPVDLVYVCGVRAALVLRLFRWLLPKIKLVHGVRWNPVSSNILDRFFRFSEKYLHKLVDGYVTNSVVAKKTMTTYCNIPVDCISTVYNGMGEIDFIEPCWNDRCIEVITVANLSRRKGHREFLQVIKRVISLEPIVKFTFIGRDDLNGEVQDNIRTEGLGDYVRYEGFHVDINPFLLDCLFCHHSGEKGALLLFLNHFVMEYLLLLIILMVFQSL